MSGSCVSLLPDAPLFLACRIVSLGCVEAFQSLLDWVGAQDGYLNYTPVVLIPAGAKLDRVF